MFVRNSMRRSLRFVLCDLDLTRFLKADYAAQCSVGNSKGFLPVGKMVVALKNIIERKNNYVLRRDLNVVALSSRPERECGDEEAQRSEGASPRSDLNTSSTILT